MVHKINNLRDFRISFLLLCSSAIILEKLGSKRSALNVIKRAITAFPNESKLYLHASRLYLKKGQVDKAVMYWKKAVGPENIGSFVYWVSKYKKQTNIVKGYSIVNNHYTRRDVSGEVKEWPVNRGDANDVGLELLEKGYIEEALQVFLQELQENKHDPLLYLNIGLTYSKLNKHYKALDHYEKAQALGLNNLELLNNKGYSLFYIKRYDEAQSCYELARGLAPNDYNVLNNLAASYLKTNEKEKALDCFMRAVQNYPEDATLHNNLAMCLEACEKTAKAIVHYDKALLYEKETHLRKHVLTNKINCLIKLKCYEEALELCNNMTFSDNEYGIWGLKAELLNELGRTEEAAESYRKALGLTG